MNKNRLPDRLKLFESLNKIVKNHEQLGLTRAEGNKIRNSAISSELTFEKYFPDRNVSDYEKNQSKLVKRRNSVTNAGLSRLMQSPGVAQPPKLKKATS